jgi:ribosome maturation factor RimP
MAQLDRVREIAERVATSEGMELVDLEFVGRGPGAVLRIFLDKPGGVTIKDCQIVSEQVGTILDVEDVIDQSYTLEVSSPGLDRKLLKPADYQRFAGKLVNVRLKQQSERGRRIQGRLLGLQNDKIQIDTGDGQAFELAFDEIEKANLVVEFGRAGKHSKRA